MRDSKLGFSGLLVSFMLYAHSGDYVAQAACGKLCFFHVIVFLHVFGVEKRQYGLPPIGFCILFLLGSKCAHFQV
jgi:hypothetical protein